MLENKKIPFFSRRHIYMACWKNGIFELNHCNPYYYQSNTNQLQTIHNNNSWQLLSNLLTSILRLFISRITRDLPRGDNLYTLGWDLLLNRI